jgi:competence protein ComEA
MARWLVSTHAPGNGGPATRHDDGRGEQAVSRLNRVIPGEKPYFDPDPEKQNLSKPCVAATTETAAQQVYANPSVSFAGQPRQTMPASGESNEFVAADSGAEFTGQLVHDSTVGRVKTAVGRHIKVLAAIVLVVAMVSAFFVTRAHSETVPSVAASVSLQAAPSVEPPPTPAMIMVHVIGEVHSPGVVTVPEGSRVADAVTAAGGMTDQADPSDLNMAAVIADGAQIIIGSTTQPNGEVRDGSASGDGSAGSSGGLVNINTANQAELETLPGVGPVTAQAIIAWRDANGKFTTVEELQNVDGIGPKTYAKLADLVCV